MRGSSLTFLTKKMTESSVQRQETAANEVSESSRRWKYIRHRQFTRKFPSNYRFSGPARKFPSQLGRSQTKESSRKNIYQEIQQEIAETSFKRRRRARTSGSNLVFDVKVYLFSIAIVIATACRGQLIPKQQQIAGSNNRLPDLVSATSDEPIVTFEGQDAFVSCVAKNLQNYTIIWRFTNEASAPGPDAAQPLSQPQPQQQVATSPSSQLQAEERAVIISAGRQRVSADDRYSVIQSHDTWLLKIKNARLSDTGTYICHTNSEPRVRALRILSVVKPDPPTGSLDGSNEFTEAKLDLLGSKDFKFTDCCVAEYVAPKCQRLCSLQQLASKYQSINIVHDCYSALPSITRCMVAGRNVTDCCQKRHTPARCNPMCGHLGDTSAMSLQDQSFCADYSATIMSCVAEGINTLPGQPELVIVEAVSSSTLKVSWQKVTEEKELQKIDGWIINLTKLSSFEDTISLNPQSSASSSSLNSPPSPPPPQSPSGEAMQSVSFSTSSNSNLSGSNNLPLANLTIVDVLNNSSLAAMTKLLAASSGTISLKLEKQSNEFSIYRLKPYTVYQIQMFAYNSLGRSQLTDPIRALTLAPESDSAASSSAASNSDAYVEPQLPDTRKCCLDRGVTLKRCLDTLCDPVEADRATIADLMICAPWSNVTFGCLSSRVNHTDCCKARGVSPFCLSMCSGDIKRVDYRHFRCLTHMGSYTNCILESHNVLPSAPLNFTVGPITHTWAVLNWRAPKQHALSLQGYRIFWRKVEPIGSGSAINRTASSTSLQLTGDPGSANNDEFFYSSAEAATNPYLLDALSAETVYETFVVAVNRYGQSESSVRFVFQTLTDPEKVSRLAGSLAPGAIQPDLESRLPIQGAGEGGTFYNETNCCALSGVHNQCMQLCDYDMKVSDVSSLVSNCNRQMPVILRCMAGSRNSVPCCRNRAVSDHCLNVCAGLTEHSPLVIASRCANDFGKIIRCMDEGSKQIPGAPVDLHTLDIGTDLVKLKWSPSSEDSLRSDLEYHVRYQQLQSPLDRPDPQSTSGAQADLSALIAVVPLHPLEHNLILTTNKTEATLDKLRPNSRYSIYLTAENSYGISLPSLVLVIQTPFDDKTSITDDFKRKATLGAPHSLEILRTDTESIVLKWIAPLFTSSDAQIKYRVFYKLLSPSGALETGSETGASSGASQQLAVSNWTVVETSETIILLKNLRYSSQYVITVQAFSKQLLGHMSEILLANTAKPIPPTLNHPLVINNPVEGNNITIMCVALGQPTPQISMFINGLLVQKRTQPYVIYHLVNLVRGHLTITCFASNGQGKDYASVQSRTEVSVKFPSKALAKTKQVSLIGPQSIARLTCEVSGNPQPTVIWIFNPAATTSGSSTNSSSTALSVDGQQKQAQKSILITPNDRITTLLVSQFENPFTWSHTLTIRNVTPLDLGEYQCRAKNPLGEASDSIQVQGVTIEHSSSSSASKVTSELDYLKQVEETWDLLECCKSQNVSAKCLPVCGVDGLDIETAFKTSECQGNLDKLMYCAADGSDHKNCCRARQVPSTCLRWCSGAKLSIPELCFLSSAMDINQCFQEGRTLLPGAPRNIRVILASKSGREYEQDMSHQLSPATTTTTTMMINANMFNSINNEQSNKQPTSGSQHIANSDTSNNNNNNNNPSVISSMVMMIGDQATGTANNPTSTESTSSSATSLNEDSSSSNQQSEPLIIEWDPPIKNPQLVQYYRIFWRPLGSRELSRTVTNLTWIKLNDLNTNKNYEFVVKAANTHGSSVYSEPLTVKPAEILAYSQSNDIAGLIWFMPTSSGAASLLGRIMVAICFATVFMFSSLAIVMFLDKRGYLKRFASSKTSSSRISFANPAYAKDSDGANDSDNITWDNGHSLDILTPPPLNQESSSSSSPPANDSTTNSSNATPQIL